MDSKELKQKFNEIFEKEIKPSLFLLEQERIVINKYEPSQKEQKFVVWVCIALIIFGVIQFVPGLMITVLVLLLYSVISNAKKNMCPYKYEEWRTRCKKSIFLPILSLFGEFNYSRNSNLYPADIHNLGLFSFSTHMKDDEVIVGKINDIDILIVESELYHIVTNKNRSYEVTDFKGLIIKIPLNKKFRSHSVIKQRNISYDAYIKMLEAAHKQNPDFITEEILNKAYASRTKDTLTPVNLLYPEKIYTPQGRTLHQVKFEDPKFDKLYSVYSDDQVESRYLITPAFMERLNNISNAILVLKSYCVFKNGYMYLFLSSQGNLVHESSNGFFEVGGLETSLYDKKCFTNIMYELISIFDLISYFKIDRKIM